MRKILFIIIFSTFLVLLFFIFASEIAKADYIYCFDSADCDTPGCPKDLLCECPPGQTPSCEPDWDSPCPLDSICHLAGYTHGEKCVCISAPAPTCAISANPGTIDEGDSSTLTWSSTDADSCNASGGWAGSKATSGNESVSPSSTTDYTINCTGSGGSCSDAATVAVTPAPRTCADCGDYDCWGGDDQHCQNNGEIAFYHANNCNFYGDGRFRCWAGYWYSCDPTPGNDGWDWVDGAELGPGGTCPDGVCCDPDKGPVPWNWCGDGYVSDACNEECEYDSHCPDDECIGTTYREYSCSDCGCVYDDYSDDPRCGYEENNAPNEPDLIAPPHNEWIDYNPIFVAEVSDPDGDDVRAYFQVTGYGSGWGDWEESGGTSNWGPKNVGSCFQNWWRAYAYDGEYDSDWSESWYVRVDKDDPSANVSNPSGTIDYATFTVSLTESDSCSGISQGDVDIRIKTSPTGGWGNWQDYSSTINNFNYTGQNNHTYWFRYRVQDNAGNWSNFDEGPQVYIQLGGENHPPTATNLNRINSDWCQKPPFYSFSWTYTDPDNDTESRFDFQADNNSNFSSPEVNRTYDNLSYPSPSQNGQPVLVYSLIWPDSLIYNQTYYWRARVWDSEGADSGWVNGTSFTSPGHAYPDPDFNWSPSSPGPDQQTQFTDGSTCYDNVQTGSDCGANDGFSWTFEDGNPATSILENPITTFSTTNGKQISLTVTDSDGFSCSITKSVSVQAGAFLPKWREIKPW